jgi:hypothetical protein
MLDSSRVGLLTCETISRPLMQVYPQYTGLSLSPMIRTGRWSSTSTKIGQVAAQERHIP